MTDYYPVIIRCVADIEPNPAARSELYWLARTELEVQLYSCTPPLTPSEMMRERLALDEAIRRFENECASQVVQSARMPTPGGQRKKLGPELRLRPEMRVSTEVRQQQARSGPTLKPASIGLRPLIRLAGVLLVIGLGSTLYWQGHHLTALLVQSPVALAHSVAKSLPPLDYYVGKLGEAGSTPLRQAK
jgi:hypothetical protein